MQENPDGAGAAIAAPAVQADLALPAEFTIYASAELRLQWLAWLDAHRDGDDCVVDAAGVSEVDASGVQLLLSLSRTLAARHMGLRLAGPSPALQTACESLGLADALLTPARHAEAA